MTDDPGQDSSEVTADCVCGDVGWDECPVHPPEKLIPVVNAKGEKIGETYDCGEPGCCTYYCAACKDLGCTECDIPDVNDDHNAALIERGDTQHQSRGLAISVQPNTLSTSNGQTANVDNRCKAETTPNWDEDQRTYRCWQQTGHLGNHEGQNTTLEWDDETTIPRPPPTTEDEKFLTFVAEFVDEWRDGRDQAWHGTCHIREAVASLLQTADLNQIKLALGVDLAEDTDVHDILREIKLIQQEKVPQNELLAKAVLAAHQALNIDMGDGELTYQCCNAVCGHGGRNHCLIGNALEIAERCVNLTEEDLESMNKSRTYGGHEPLKPTTNKLTNLDLRSDLYKTLEYVETELNNATVRDFGNDAVEPPWVDKLMAKVSAALLAHDGLIERKKLF
jgi:hypothetical protein